MGDILHPTTVRNSEKSHGLGLAGAGGSPRITLVESLALPSWWAAVTWTRRAIFWWAASAASWIVSSPKDAPNHVVLAKRSLGERVQGPIARFLPKQMVKLQIVLHSLLSILLSQASCGTHHRRCSHDGCRYHKHRKHFSTFTIFYAHYLYVFIAERLLARSS